MRVLITGALGYVGVALARRLAREHEVIALGRPPRACAADGVRAALAGIECIEVGQARAREADAIVHLAGGGGPAGCLADPTAALIDNIECAARVAMDAAPSTRLLLASTIYIYGTGPRPFRETDTCAPDTLYGKLKSVAEAVWQQRAGTALRFAHVYGVGSGVDFGRDGVTERLARAAAGGEPFTMHGDGSQRLDLVHIDDACEAVARALAAESLPPAVNVGGGAPVAVADLARAFGVQPRAGSPTMVCEYGSDEPADAETGTGVRFKIFPSPTTQRAMDISLAASALGWAPRVTLAEGARGLVEMFSRQGSDHAQRQQ